MSVYHSPELAEFKQKIQNLHIQDNIMLMPCVSHGDCMEYVRRSSFYLSTAINEGLPLAVIEAMSVGKAIIASNVVGNKDCVKNGINGYLLPLIVNDFADKIIELAQNDELRDKMGKKSRELFVNEFFIKNRIHLLQEKYENVCSQ